MIPAFFVCHPIANGRRQAGLLRAVQGSPLSGTDDADKTRQIRLGFWADECGLVGANWTGLHIVNIISVIGHYRRPGQVCQDSSNRCFRYSVPASAAIP